MNFPAMAFMVPIVAILAGTGMITAITVNIIRAVSREKVARKTGVPAELLARLKALEERLEDQEAVVGKLREENAFLVKLLEEGRDTARD